MRTGTILPVAGHSLGGALATLAAYDIRQQLQDAGQGSVEVVCYSFGAPRTGNHAFAHDYNRKVPDTWSIINDQVGTVHGAYQLVSLYSGHCLQQRRDIGTVRGASQLVTLCCRNSSKHVTQLINFEPKHACMIHNSLDLL